jgi:hypothetical protein
VDLPAQPLILAKPCHRQRLHQITLSQPLHLQIVSLPPAQLRQLSSSGEKLPPHIVSAPGIPQQRRDIRMQIRHHGRPDTATAEPVIQHPGTPR